ncbi:hypothetical protein [Uliginosibacterium flavum]
MEPVTLSFWWEWKCGSPFWPANEAALNRFGYGSIAPEELGLPIDLAAKLVDTSDWHDKALNWEYPPDPGPWRQVECDQFNEQSKDLFNQCCAAFGASITLVYKHRDEREDPDLDRYLADPKKFRR